MTSCKIFEKTQRFFRELAFEFLSLLLFVSLNFIISTRQICLVPFYRKKKPKENKLLPFLNKMSLTHCKITTKEEASAENPIFDVIGLDLDLMYLFSLAKWPI